MKKSNFVKVGTEFACPKNSERGPDGEPINGSRRNVDAIIPALVHGSGDAELAQCANDRLMNPLKQQNNLKPLEC